MKENLLYSYAFHSSFYFTLFPILLIQKSSTHSSFNKKSISGFQSFKKKSLYFPPWPNGSTSPIPQIQLIL